MSLISLCMFKFPRVLIIYMDILAGSLGHLSNLVDLLLSVFDRRRVLFDNNILHF